MRFVYKGNVHEIYEISTDCLAIVTSDRISVHGQLLPVEIRNKGVILNSISLFWFQMTEDIICNHLIEKLYYNDEKALAAASFNLHGTAFTKPFNIKIRNVNYPVTGCIGFGIERWVLGFLAQYGLCEKNWPKDVRNYIRKCENQ